MTSSPAVYHSLSRENFARLESFSGTDDEIIINVLNHIVELIGVRFSEFDVTRRTRKGNFLNQIDYQIDWVPIEKAVAEHYAPTSDAADRPSCLSRSATVQNVAGRNLAR